MTIETREDLEGMARVGKVVSLALNEMTNRAGGLAPTPRLLAILSAVGLLLILGGGYVSRVRRPWAAPWPQRDVIGVPPRRVNSNKNVTEGPDFLTVHSNDNVTGQSSPPSFLVSLVSGFVGALDRGHNKPVGKCPHLSTGRVPGDGRP